MYCYTIVLIVKPEVYLLICLNALISEATAMIWNLFDSIAIDYRYTVQHAVAFKGNPKITQSEYAVIALGDDAMWRGGNMNPYIINLLTGSVW